MPRNSFGRPERISPENQQILFRAAHWIDANRKARKTIWQLAQTEENYLLIIREMDRVSTQLQQARSLGADATLTLVQWLTTLQDFAWQCAYCQSRRFQVMTHVIALPQGGTTADNCIPACYGCKTKYKNNMQIQERIRAYLVNRKSKDESA